MYGMHELLVMFIVKYQDASFIVILHIVSLSKDRIYNRIIIKNNTTCIFCISQRNQYNC